MDLEMSIHKRFQIWLVQLDPTQGHEVKKTRPCIIISPDEMMLLATILIAPMTTQGFDFPCRVKCTFRNKQGLILLDQIRAVDKNRLIKKLGTINQDTQIEICKCLQEMFNNS